MQERVANRFEIYIPKEIDLKEFIGQFEDFIGLHIISTEVRWVIEDLISNGSIPVEEAIFFTQLVIFSSSSGPHFVDVCLPTKRFSITPIFANN